MNVSSARSPFSAIAQAQGLEVVFDSANDALMLYHLDDDDRPLPYIRVNDAASRLYGYSREELLSLTACDLLEPHVDYKQVAHDLLTHGTLVCESTHITKDGRRLIVEVSAHRFVLNGRPTVLTIGRDLSDRRRTEEALAEQTRTLETIIRVNESTAGELDLDKLVQQVTDAGTELTGAQFGALFYLVTGADGDHRTEFAVTGIERSVFEGFPLPRKTERFGTMFHGQRIFRSDDLTRETQLGEQPPFEHLPAGHPPVRSYLSVPLVSRSGQVLGGLFLGHAEPGRFTDKSESLIGGIAAQTAVAMDNARLYRAAQSELADRRRAQEELASLNETLEQRVAERTAVAEQRAEQLTVLAAELTHAEQRERRRLARTLHDGLQQLLVAAKLRLGLVAARATEPGLKDPLRQVESLLDQSVAMSRSLTVQLSPPILYDAGLAPALEWLGRWIQQTHNVQVDSRIDADAEPEAEAVRVLLFEAVRELLFNVVKHAGVDSATLQMTRLGDSQVRIIIRDAGVGFEPARAETSQFASQGIGLMSVRERLGFLGGRLEISSGVGRGTCMTLTAPRSLHPIHSAPPPVVGDADRRVAAGATPDGEVDPYPQYNDREGSYGTIRVLLADDHKILRQGLVSLLEEEDDIEVVGEAEDGTMAVELAMRTRPDVVVMDITMPGISGIDATRQITAALPSVRVIGLSMHSESDMGAAIREAGATAYVTKGGPSESLIAAIRGA